MPPVIDTGGQSPFDAVERVLLGFTRARLAISLYAIPLFLWFATRLFASVRTALTLVYDVPRRPTGQHFVVGFLAGKLRDAVMVLFTLALMVINASLTAGLRVLAARRQDLVHGNAGLELLSGGPARWLGAVLAFGFSVGLFYVVFRHASPRRLPRRAALAGSLFTALLFEIAKRFYGWYLVHQTLASRFSADANVVAILLFILWLYYTALVFLLGAVVAETWDLLGRQRSAAPPRPVLAQAPATE